MVPSNVIPGRRIPKRIKALFFFAMILQLTAIMLIAQAVSLQDIVGGALYLFVQYNVTAAYLGAVMLLLSYLMTIFGFYRLVYPLPQKGKTSSGTSFSHVIRIILILVGFVNVYLYVKGAPQYTLYVAGSGLGVGTLFNQIMHVFASIGGVGNNLKSLIGK